jgi:hypothetical protein
MKMPAFTLMLSVLLALASCKSTYVPTVAQVPLMSVGDEFQIAANIGNNGYGASLAYSPYYHWALMANGNTYALYSGRQGATTSFRCLYGEFGTGYYTRLSKILRAEVFGGYGAGNSGHPVASKELYRKIFLQPSIGISTPFVDLGFTTRLAWVNNFAIKQNDISTPRNLTTTFLEPILTARAGFENFKFQLQGGLSFPLGSVGFTHRTTFVGFGFHLTFGKDFENYN